MKKSISIIGSVGIPGRYGGFETLTEQLSLHLSDKFSIHVFCSTFAYLRNERSKVFNGVNRIFIPLKANGLSSILYDLWSICIGLKISATLLILGGGTGMFFPFIRLLFPNKKIIFHPDGLEWKRENRGLLTKLFLFISIKAGCRFCNHIIVDNYSLVNYYKKYKNKLSIISYGGDHLKLHSKPLNKNSYWLTIARAVSDNNLELIAKSFTELKDEKWVLVSNWQQSKYGNKLVKKYSKFSNIIFYKANYNHEVLSNLLSECKGYIHGHSSGGSNPALIAAMWANKPLYIHNNIFNNTTTNNKAVTFGDKETLIEKIRQYNISSDYETHELEKLAQNQYKWNKIMKEYYRLLNSI